MKKTAVLLSLFLFSAIFLVACEKTQIIEDTINIENPDCEKAIRNYLDGADKKGKGTAIKAGDNIIVDYIGRLSDGTVFDTSIESVAKACNKYNEARDYTQGLSFEVGAGQMIKGFDNGVLGMKLGQTKTVNFGPDEGYGQRNKEYIISYTKDEIGDLNMYKVGGYFQPNQFIYGTIISITDKEMVVDFNHELAGKDLIFDITVKSIN